MSPYHVVHDHPTLAIRKRKYREKKHTLEHRPYFVAHCIFNKALSEPIAGQKTVTTHDETVGTTGWLDCMQRTAQITQYSTYNNIALTLNCTRKILRTLEQYVFQRTAHSLYWKPDICARSYPSPILYCCNNINIRHRSTRYSINNYFIYDRI